MCLWGACMYAGIQQMLQQVGSLLFPVHFAAIGSALDGDHIPTGTVKLSGSSIAVIFFRQALHIRRHSLLVQHKASLLILHRQSVLRCQKRGTVRCCHRMSLFAEAVDNIAGLKSLDLFPQIPQGFLTLIRCYLIVTSALLQIQCFLPILHDLF